MPRKHVLVIVMPAFGHYIPGLELSKKLAPHHDVTLCISSFKVPEIKQRDIMPPEPIQLFGVDDKLSFNLDERIHEAKEATEAMNDMYPHYETFINSLSTPEKPSADDHSIAPVSAIFVDMTFPLPIKYGHARSIPTYAFSPFSPIFLTFFGNMDENTPTMSEEAFLDGSMTDVTKMGIPEFMKKQAIENCFALTLATEMLFNSFQELEPKILETFSQMPRFASIPKKFIGPILPTNEHLDQKKNELEHHILDWLDIQDSKSVIYFSFGTVAVPKPEQIVEVAEALTSLNRPFVWALRPFLQKHLPEQYRVSTADSFDGKAPHLIVPWAPQKRVLAHKSTGVFVSHCGWNSTLEAVYYGVPIVGWPMFGDQHVNAVMLEQLGAGMMLKGTGVIGRIVPKVEIMEAILKVAGWKEDAGASSYRQIMEELGVKARAATGPAGQSTRNLLSVINQI